MILAIRLLPERAAAGDGRGDIAYVSVEFVDAQGQVVPDQQIELKVSVSGPGELAAFGSASPFATGSLQAAEAVTWDGRGQISLHGTDRSGVVKIRATPALVCGRASRSFV